MAGSGALDPSVLEHHIFPLDNINEALTAFPPGTAVSLTSSADPPPDQYRLQTHNLTLRTTPARNP
jgi:hypothetical protein